MIYYHNSELGCGLGEARDLRAAEREVRQEIGSYHAAAGFTVRKATNDDIAWVKGSGGYVPESLLVAETRMVLKG